MSDSLEEKYANIVLPEDELVANNYQRWLKRIGVFNIVMGILGIILSNIFIVFMIVAVVSNTEMTTMAEENPGALVMAGMESIISSIVTVLIGVFALRGAKNAVKVRPYIALAAINMAYNGAHVIWNIATGSTQGIGSILFSLVTIALDGLFLAVGVMVDRTKNADRSQRDFILASRVARKDRRKLGFLRVIQVLYALNVLFTAFALIFINRDRYYVDMVRVGDWLVLVVKCICFWLIWKRLRIARWGVVGLSAFNIIVSIVTMVSQGQFSFVELIIRSFIDIIVIVYMLTSKRVSAQLSRELSMEVLAPYDINEKPTRKGWPFVRNLILYYCVFSVLGHWMELGFCMLIRAGIVAGDYDPSNTMLWRDLLFPFPMEGIAVVICALWLYPLKNWLVSKFKHPAIGYVLSFIINGLVCTAIEFIGGITFNAQHQHWDYSNLPFNFMGQICLQNAIGFAVACSIIAWLIYPMLERLIARVPKDIMNIITVGVLTFNIFLQVLYLVEPDKIADAFGQIGNFFSGNKTAAYILPYLPKGLLRLL